jgi:hypothetical protein
MLWWFYSCKIYLLLINIFIFNIYLYLINKYFKVEIKFMRQKCFVEKIIKLLWLWDFYYIKTLFLNVHGQYYIKLNIY